MMIRTRNTKVLGSSTLALTILLNLALIIFAVYLSRSAHSSFLCYIITDAVVGGSGIIAACIGLAGFINQHITALSAKFYHAIVSVIFSLSLSALHIISAQYLKGSLKDYKIIYNCFFTTASAFGLLVIANAYIAILITCFIKEKKLEGYGGDKMEIYGTDKLNKTCNSLGDTTYSIQV